ncbi:MAG: type II secretion system F family protein [Candidatus Xenobium sp.]|jgi:type IV pilus assembly protein PilC|nr:type II secretion system F family protein [Burkholderiales bacterium]
MASETSTPPPVPGTLKDHLFGLGLKKKAFFFRELATLVEAGVPLTRAAGLAGGHVEPRLEASLTQTLEQGNLLSTALGRHPCFFGEFEIALVAAGEAGGCLDLRLKDLAQALESQSALLMMLLSKLWYPLIVLHLAIFVPTLPLLVLQGPAPYLTATLGTLVPLYALAGLAFLFWRLGFRPWVEWVLGKVPVLGTTLRNLAAARFLGALGHLYESGLPISRCVALAARSSGNSRYAAQVAPAAQKVDSGMSLSQALSQTGGLPRMALQMLQTGEESGRLPEMLARTATWMHGEVENTAQKVMTLLPVLIMLAVGALVGLMVIRFYAGHLQMIMQL